MSLYANYGAEGEKERIEDEKLLKRIDTHADGLSARQIDMLESFMRRVFKEKRALSPEQRRIAVEWDEKYVE